MSRRYSQGANDGAPSGTLMRAGVRALLLSISSLALLSGCVSPPDAQVSASETAGDGASATISGRDRASRVRDPVVASALSEAAVRARGRVAGLCRILDSYPRPADEPRAFESGQVAPLCRPFVNRGRASLDLCGDRKADPYSSPDAQRALRATKTVSALADVAPGAGLPVASPSVSEGSLSPATHLPSTVSNYTWTSRRELYRRGKVNVYDPPFRHLVPEFYKRADAIRADAARTCCADDKRCHAAMGRVDIALCKPNPNPDEPDPCVFSGRFDMAGSSYSMMFRNIYRLYATGEEADLRKIAESNLSSRDLTQISTLAAPMAIDDDGEFPAAGRIVMSSYVPRSDGVSALEPTLQHEFGHACSIIRMQLKAVSGKSPEARDVALRAVRWIDKAKARCSSDLELPQSYYDFWESLGESRELAACLYKITELNRQGAVDRPCEKLCPGHYLEESVGVAFAMLNGDLRGGPNAVFPNTCDHVRDGQHPMVSDIVDCLAQHSSRFRRRLRETYGCGPEAAPVTAGTTTLQSATVQRD